MKNVALVRIYWANTAPLENEKVFAELYERVSAQRKEKIDRLRVETEKRLSLGAESLLLRACRDFGVDYHQSPVLTDAYGKPYFENRRFNFNLSHSGERVLCAVSAFPVGCDTEKQRAIDVDIVAKRFFSTEEYEALKQCGEQEKTDLFFRLWTLKESFVKCVGLGLQLPLKSFSLYENATGLQVRQTQTDGNFTFFEQNAGDGYKYACCVKAAASDVCTAEWLNVQLEALC